MQWVRRASVVVVSAVGVLTLAALPAMHLHAADVNDFTISSFDADYYLSRDASHTSQLTVDEKITADFPYTDQNHGIERAIPETYKKHSLQLKVLRVADQNGRPLHYTTRVSNDNLVLRIGDADKYMHGAQTYDVRYTMQNVTTNYDDHDELYWDVNGDQWSQPFDEVTARVHVPASLANQMQQRLKCFAGSYGSESDCNISSETGGDETVTTVSAHNLQPNQTLTYVLGFQPHTFAAYHRTVGDVIPPALRIPLLATVVVPVVALLVMWLLWRRYGRDAEGRGTIIPEYLPPKELSVIGSSVLIKESFSPAAISAQMLDLTVRHYFKIYEVKAKRRLRKDITTYDLELVKAPSDLRDDEREVVRMLFGKEMAVGTRIHLKDLTNKLYKPAGKLGKKVERQLAGEDFFRTEPNKARLPYAIVGAVLLVGGFFTFFLGAGVLLAGAIVLLGSRYMAARTKKGVASYEYLQGLRDYMKLAEAERIKVLQSPHGQLTERIDVGDNAQLVKLYEKLLPYAALFGIEKEWAKEFAHLYTEPPEWYVGTGNAFNAAFVVGMVGNFSAAANSAFTSPASSSGSGFSGGGGFAGGGGGGGGGGGW